MSTEQRTGDPDRVASGGIMARWSWRRMERRAVAGHEDWLAAQLRGLAAAQVYVFRADGDAISAAAAGIVRLRHRGGQLLLAGVAAAPRAALERAARQGRLQLDAAGRYGKFWWIEVISDGAARGEKVVLLGSHLRLAPASGGRGRVAGLQPVASPA
jgi:hypothetical protein